MFKTTSIGKVQKLLDYYERVRYNQWVLLGNTSPWENDSIPPQPSSTITNVVEPLAFFKVTSYQPIYLSLLGNISTSSKTYQSITIFDKQTLIDLNISSLLITCNISNSLLPSSVYRSAGLCNNLSSNTQTPFQLYNSSITYDLEAITYFSPLSTSNTLQTNILRFIIDF